MTKSGGFFLENSPQTEAEAIAEEKVNKIVEKIMDEASERRRILTLEELCEVKSPEAKYEKFYPEVQAFFYSINGELRGEKLNGAMLAGHCMLVFALNREQATHIARQGLIDTITLTNEYATSDQAYLDTQHAQAANSGLSISAHGRKVH